jgi:hypothetical protein
MISTRTGWFSGPAIPAQLDDRITSPQGRAAPQQSLLILMSWFLILIRWARLSAQRLR